MVGGQAELGQGQLRDEWKSVKASLNPKPDIIRPATVRQPSKSPEQEQMAMSPDFGYEAEMAQGDVGAPAGLFDFEVKDQDRWLPIANVARLMKSAIPDNAKISTEAKQCMQECVSEFISFITSEAAEKCQQDKRKTVNGEDVLFAMTSLGFENYAEALKIFLSKYREMQPLRGERHVDDRPSSSDIVIGGAGPEVADFPLQLDLGIPSPEPTQESGGDPLRDERGRKARVNPKPTGDGTAASAMTRRGRPLSDLTLSETRALEDVDSVL